MSTNMKRYAETCGRTDAMDGTGFFPEQLPPWAQVWYTLGFLTEQPGNEFAQAWMRRRLERVEEARFAAEYEAALAVGRRYEDAGDVRVFA